MRKLFSTEKMESSRSAWYRRVLNFWPCMWCSGGKVTFISSDFMELHVKLSLNMRTRNRVGTVFGGSIYSSVDPYFMLMFMENLGKNYVVWDKGASIKFVRPITNTVRCICLITDEMHNQVVNRINEMGEYTFEMPIQYVDENNTVYAVFTKTLYAADKQFYKNKQAGKQLLQTNIKE